MEIWFYHLRSQTLDRALPTIIEKALARRWRVIVQTVDDLRAKALDNLLWTYRPDSFLPHALAEEKGAKDQPVLITCAVHNPNIAHLRIFVETAEVSAVEGSGYQRVIAMFDGENEGELTSARRQWTRLKAEGHALTYWQQTAEGSWDRKS